LGFIECSPRKIIKVSFRNAFLLAEGLITQDNSLMFDLQGAMQRKGTLLYVDITAAIKYLRGHCIALKALGKRCVELPIEEEVSWLRNLR
jgi:hypothetical protein